MNHINMDDTSLVVILGMHRSGTSVLARCMEIFGFSLGNRLMPAQADNPKGFFEDEEIVDLNNEMLVSMGSSWDKISIIHEDEVRSLHDTEFFSRAVHLIEKRLQSFPRFAVKDPRFVLLLPFWKKVLASCNVPVKYVLPVRNPTSVAASLKKRNGMELGQGIQLWLAYVLASFRYSDGETRVVVDYDALLEDSSREISRISSALHLPLDEEKLHLFQEEFLDHSLRHTAVDLQSLRENLECPEMAGDLYQLLLKVAADELILESPEVKDRIAALIKEFMWQEIYHRLAENQTTRDALQLMQEKNKNLELLLEIAVTEKEALEKENIALMEQLDTAHEQMEILRKQVEMVSLERDRITGALERATQRYKTIEGSTIWTMTSPVRKIMDRLKKSRLI
ncbi:hypothetical protein JWG39_06710 [Desulforhopalus vacuolatus]|uniref:sulfotransferase family protein n=1 Tax=Desulforhopalus vacuolatus TaxID=40414 RepID=UPI00196332C3|nr:hypothetical protein [Desulforhopalus vacuolatus]MBM9519510.1 hypothetical protein [Desulforhopalus vacuolatus]